MAVGITYYVATNGANVSPYTNWANAAVTITAAVSAATDGDTVLVSNGVYSTTPGSHIILDKGITLTSVNGYAHTIVAGNQPPTISNRVFYLNHTNVVVDGFSITNGYSDLGGGIYLSRGTVRNCLITGNIPAGGGNRLGGGIFMPNTVGYYSNRLVENCTIEYNIGIQSQGAGVYGLQGGQFINCIIRNNLCQSYGGGIGMSGQGWFLKNCLIYNNQNTHSSYDGGGIYVGVTNSTIINCTIVSNYSARFGGGVYIATLVDTNTFINCIIYSNACASGSSTNGNIYDSRYPTNSSPIFSNCCSTSNRTFHANENNNITNEPLISDWNGLNYRLQTCSPCINAGVNQSWMNSAVDLDGLQRIRYGTVDIGCYECIMQGTICRFY